MTAGLISFLNFTRWLAAFMVLAAHTRNLLLVDMKYVAASSALIKLLYFMTSFGHQAVVVFFVVSGFLVGGQTLLKWSVSPPDVGAYFIARTSRIYTVLVPALVVGGLLDYVGSRYFNQSGLYTDGSAKFLVQSQPASGEAHLTAGQLIGNLLHLQGIRVHTYGTNGPLWSLAYEWWYYCIFGLGLAAIRSPRHRWLGLGAALITLALPVQITLLGSIWCGGVLARWLVDRAPRLHWAWPAIAFVVASSLARLFPQKEALWAFSSDAVVGLTFAALLVSIGQIDKAIPLQRFHAQAANVSFSMYLFHFPALVFLVAASSDLLGQPFRNQPDGQGLAYYGIALCLLVAYSYLFARIFESRTDRVRSHLTNLFKAA